MINVPLGLALIASVDADEVGPASAIAMMVRSLGGPLVLGRHPGRHHVAHAAPGRHPRAGEVHERRPVARAGPRLRLRLDVAGRGSHPHRRSGAVHRLHRATGGAHPSGTRSSSKPFWRISVNRQGGHASPRDGVDQPLRRVGSFDVTSAKPRAAQQLLKMILRLLQEPHPELFEIPYGPCRPTLWFGTVV
jgi:hypothetical protein